MTKIEFIHKVAEDTHAPYSHAEPWVNAVLNSLADAITAEDSVQFMGFGKFEHIARKARHGRNASTGELIPIPARTVVKFTPAKQIAQAVSVIPVESDE